MSNETTVSEVTSEGVATEEAPREPARIHDVPTRVYKHEYTDKDGNEIVVYLPHIDKDTLSPEQVRTLRDVHVMDKDNKLASVKAIGGYHNWWQSAHNYVGGLSWSEAFRAIARESEIFADWLESGGVAERWEESVPESVELRHYTPNSDGVTLEFHNRQAKGLEGELLASLNGAGCLLDKYETIRARTKAAPAAGAKKSELLAEVARKSAAVVAMAQALIEAGQESEAIAALTGGELSVEQVDAMRESE